MTDILTKNVDLPITQILQGLNLGVAVVEPESWEIVMENGKFFNWFPNLEDQGATLAERLPRFEAHRAGERLAKNRPFSFEREIKEGARSTPIRMKCATSRSLSGP